MRKKWALVAAALVIAAALASKGGGAPVPAGDAGTKEPGAAQLSEQPAEVIASADPRACEIKSLTKNTVVGIKSVSPDGRTYVMNKEDASGTGQVYIGTAGSDEVSCITCAQKPGGPRPDRYKTQATFHPSGRWIVFGVERDEYSKPPVLGESRDYIEGQIRNGLYVNVWAVTPDGERWFRLTDLKDGPWGVPTPAGITGPVFSPDGKKAMWSQIVDGNILAYWPFGRWELMLADFDDGDGVPKLKNEKNITPPGMHWNEPGNFAPDGRSFIFSGSVEKDAQGMDQYRYDIGTGRLTNLTNSPTVWDEHGRLSPDGRKIVWMSAHPYREDPDSSKVLSIRTEFMMMNADGTGIVQLTHFRTPGRPESSDGIAANPEWDADGRSLQLRQLIFPNYNDWTLTFNGACGKAASSGRVAE